MIGGEFARTQTYKLKQTQEDAHILPHKHVKRSSELKWEIMQCLPCEIRRVRACSLALSSPCLGEPELAWGRAA